MKQKRLKLLAAPILTVVLVMVGMRLYLNYASNKLRDEFMAQNFAELERSDMAALSVRINGVFDVSSVVCAEGKRFNFSFFSRNRGECKEGLFKKWVKINRSRQGGAEVTFVYALPGEVYLFAAVILIAGFGLLGIYNWASSAIERERQLAQKEIEKREHEKNAAIVNATQNISHDLKGPIGVMAKILDTASWPEVEALMPSYKSALFRLQTMVSSLKEADIEQLIRDTWMPLSFNKVVKELSSSFPDVSIELEEALPNALKIDGPKVERAVSNLIINAVEAGAKALSCKAQVNGYSLEVIVLDDGPGVPENLVQKIFDRGFSYGKETGTGIGLSFVLSTARGHGGDVNYQRVNNQTVFTLTFPNVILKSPPLPAESLEINEQNGEYPQTTSSSSSKILVWLSDYDKANAIMSRLQPGQSTLSIADFDRCSLVLTDDIEIMERCLQSQKRFILDSMTSVELMATRLEREWKG